MESYVLSVTRIRTIELRRKSCPVGLPSTVALFNLEIQWASNKRMVGGFVPLKVTQYKALSKSIRYSVGFYSLKNREGNQFSLLSGNSQIISCNWARRWGQKMWTRWNTLRLWGFIGMWRRRRPFYLPHLARSLGFVAKTFHNFTRVHDRLTGGPASNFCFICIQLLNMTTGVSSSE